MASPTIENPLAKFSLFRSNDIDDAHLKIAKSVSPHRVGILGNAESLDVNFTGVHINSMPLVGVYYGAKVEVIPEQCDYYFTQTTLTGAGVVEHGTEQYETTAGDTAVVSPAVPYKMKLDKGCHRLAIGIKPSELNRYVSKLINDEVNEELIFDLKLGSSVAWRNTINYITHQICDEPRVLASPSIQKMYSDLIISNLLELHNHNYVAKINAKEDYMLSPQVKQAADYVQHNIKDAIAVADLAQHCKVSLRTLQRNFLRHMNVTPAKYIRDAKLNAIHSELESIRQIENGTVKRVLLDYSICDFGRFAQYYRNKFGCTPKETVSKAIHKSW